MMFSGRINRVGFLLGIIYFYLPVFALLALFVITILLNNGATSGAGNSLSSIVDIIIFLFSVAWMIMAIPIQFGLIIRRWHDIGQTGWLAILQLVPLVGLITFLILLFTPGTTGPNTYGQPRLHKGFRAVLFGSS